MELRQPDFVSSMEYESDNGDMLDIRGGRYHSFFSGEQTMSMVEV